MTRRSTLILISVMLVVSLVLITLPGAEGAPPSENPGNPFEEILQKLDQLQTQVDLRGVTQNWDKNLPSASRFTVLAAFNHQAVRDNNTGLVWEQSPATNLESWFSARFACADKNVGGTRGWRLPSVAELASLNDPSLPAPRVPTTVFTGVQSAEYWSATTNAQDSTFAWVVNFANLVEGVTLIKGKIGSFHVWCVRGDMNADVY